MDINEVIDSCQYENVNAKVDFERWLMRVTPLFDKKDVKEVLKSKQQLCQMFYLQKNSGVSRQSYQKIKRHIMTLQKFFNVTPVIPSREDVLKAGELTCFYRNLDSLLDFVDHVGESSFSNYDSSEDLLNVKAIAILGWHGFTLDETASLQKHSLHSATNVYSVNEVEIEEKFFNILKKLAVSEEYRGLPSGRLQKYRSDDKYLFRSIIADQNFTENHLADVLKRFNRKASLFSRAIVFRHLRKNALFIVVSEDKSPKKLSEKIKDIFDCDIKTAYGIEKEFVQWQKDVSI